MGYDWMDHVGWAERNIAASKRMSTSAHRKRAHDGRGWLAAPEKLSPFQARVITILGIIGGGIYNAPISWESITWTHPKLMTVTWERELSTVDFSALTLAVFLAHDAAIRFTVQPCMRNLKLCFWQRERRPADPQTSEGCLSLEDAVTAYRNRFPLHHHVHLEPTALPTPIDPTAEPMGVQGVE